MYPAVLENPPLRVKTSARVVSPAPRGIWSEVVRDDPTTTALQTPEYFDAVLAASGGRDASRLYELPDGRRLVLPLIRSRSLPGLRFEAAYPGGYGHGSMLATGGLRADDVRMVVEDLRGRGAGHGLGHSLSTRIGGGHHTAEQWSAGGGPGVVEVPRRVEVIDLSPGIDELKTNVFDRRVRQSMRKAARCGLQVERDTTGRLVHTFYEIYLAWVERWIPRSGLPPAVARRRALREEPLEKFQNVTALMGDKCRIFVVSHHGVPVASCITFVHGQHAIGWRSYSIRELANPVEANTFAQVAGIEDACASGCTYFDLGQSGEAGDLLSFKHKLGATPRPVIDLRIEPPALTSLRALKERGESAVVKLLSKASAP